LTVDVEPATGRPREGGVDSPGFRHKKHSAGGQNPVLLEYDADGHRVSYV